MPSPATARWEEWRRWRSCTRKHVWLSRILAENWVTLLMLKYGDRGDSRLEAYRCRYCGYWHVGRKRNNSRPREAT